ncbi:MAG: hypothetical protein MUE53_04425 [Chitinophagales bacterium]|jgi:hypothetical protein|nr:hypothetical protein [Chitinophagales bacterium]
MKWFLFCLLGFSAFFFYQCSDKEANWQDFYYFRTMLSSDSSEILAFQQYKVQRLITKYFDIKVLDGAIYPEAKLQVSNNFLQFQKRQNIDIVPLIYIQQQVFQSPILNLDSLSTKVSRLIQKIDSVNEFNVNKILHIDCDWTPSTQKPFFEFLSLLQAKTNYKTHVTLRLHQIKYHEKTGIPPADSFVLMFYNFGNLGIKEKNSIFNTEDYQKYITSLKYYPKPLQIAMPVFSWWLRYRDGQLISLISSAQLPIDSIKANTKSLSNDEFIFEKEKIMLNFVFQTDEILKLEKIPIDDLRQASQDLKSQYAKGFQRVYWYELNPEYLKSYDITFLNNIQQILLQNE